MKTLNEKATKLLNLANDAMRADHIDVKMVINSRQELIMILKGIKVVNEMLTNKVNELIQQGDVANIMEAEDKYEEIGLAMGALCNAENVVDRLETDIILKYTKQSRNSYYSAEENYELALIANEIVKHYLGVDFIEKYINRNTNWFC